MKLENKIAFVTGGGSGIGQATCLKLAGEGAHVVVTDIDEVSGKQVHDLIQKQGLKSSFYKLDVSSQKEVSNIFKKVKLEFGYVDLAVNNAGIGGKGSPLHEIKSENWEKMMAINLNGVFYCMQEEIKMMIQNHGGRIVNISSIAGVKGIPGGGSYVAAKHAVIGLSRTAAREYAQAGIKVNAICPGFVETPILKDVPDNMLQFSTQYQVPMKRLGQPEEVANAIAWLLSEESSYVNGHSLILDGGLMA